MILKFPFKRLTKSDWISVAASSARATLASAIALGLMQLPVFGSEPMKVNDLLYEASEGGNAFVMATRTGECNDWGYQVLKTNKFTLKRQNCQIERLHDQRIIYSTIITETRTADDANPQCVGRAEVYQYGPEMSVVVTITGTTDGTYNELCEPGFYDLGDFITTVD